jgi:phosphate transport system substrate-binding protein
MFKTLSRGLVVAGLMLAGVGVAQAETRIQGGGASFPAPLYAKWTAAFNEANKNVGVTVDYQQSGSGAGIKGLTDRTLDFAGSDAPLTDAQEKALPATALHIPSVAGPEVMIYNVAEIKGQLTLDGATVANIFLGKITKWDDAAIKKLNPNIALPSKDIVVVHRADGSGTTYIFTNYLAKVSADWKDTVGNGASVKWPTGQGGKGNPGVADVVKRVDGAIGYVEYAYAKSNQLAYAAQVNKAGKTVTASIEGVEAAAAESLKELPADLKISITDAPGDASYPICGFTYLLVYQDLGYFKDKTKAEWLVKYIDWCVTDGQALAKDVGYAKLPADVAKKVDEKIRSIKFDGQDLMK